MAEKTYGIVMLFDSGLNEDAKIWAMNNSLLLDLDKVQINCGKHIPHLSMLHLVLNEMGVAEAKMKLQLFAGGYSMTGSFSSVRTYPGGYVFWLTPRTETLDRLHATCVKRFARLRSGPVPIAWPMNKQQQAMHNEYGYPSVMAGFNPHMTLGVLKPDASVSDDEMFARWKNPKLALVEIGEYGVATRVIESVDL